MAMLNNQNNPNQQFFGCSTFQDTPISVNFLQRGALRGSPFSKYPQPFLRHQILIPKREE